MVQYFSKLRKIKEFSKEEKMDLLWKSISLIGLSVWVAGCAASQVGDANLQMRIKQLERTVSTQEQAIEALRQKISIAPDHSMRSSSLLPTAGVTVSSDSRGIIRVAADPKDVQSALQKAGYYAGNIDGKIGSQTIEAIRQFQKDNNLKVDGIVGSQTWTKMSNISSSSVATLPISAE